MSFSSSASSTPPTRPSSPTASSSSTAPGFGYEHDEAWKDNLRLFGELTDVTRGVRRLGAAAVDLCHVAEGIVDGYWEYRLKPWDMAAGCLILTEAGGVCTTMTGDDFSVFDRSILCAGADMHRALVPLTRASVEKLVGLGVDMSRWFIPEGYQGL